ncbi:uncharacterized protein LOC129826442 [Salvelinus fontinalis]|uniref:uncharacterized protein LOC129826442 n=1 Tax=Salvelinus fontinalis TaxID=8038 RepID=UPI00248532E3|nr:uncharacterized protein LOC129826442 [Salvelinus fontinalis]
MNHQILLSTLSVLGVSGSAHSWIVPYLAGHSYQVATHISVCLSDISAWMSAHHLNLDKTALLFHLGKACPLKDLSITVDKSTVSPSQSVKNLGVSRVTLDNTLSFSANIKAVTCSCRFMLYNIHRVRPYLTQEAAQVLMQGLVLSCLDYCNSLLAGLPTCAIKPLQIVQNAATRLVFNIHKFSHVTPLLRTCHKLTSTTRPWYLPMEQQEELPPPPM